jgi:F-type H+-transporting ATPase subunit b
MLIDWFTVVAQIVNFIILVALLKHFLYGPLVRTIDAREKRIADRLAEAAAKNREADQHIAKADAQTTEIEVQRAQILNNAQAAADETRKELVRGARESVRALESRWRKDLDREKDSFLDEIRRRASTEMLSITRCALADLANTKLEQATIDVFLEQLQSMDPCALRAIAGSDFSVFSSTELPEEVRQGIREIIGRHLGGPTPIRFETAPSMAWGIELRGCGQRVGWTSDTYLDTLDANLRTALERRVEEPSVIAG